LWHAGHFDGLETTAVTGERVTIVSGGEPSDGAQGVWLAAEVVVDGERRRGTVVIGEDSPIPTGAVLRLVDTPATPVLGADDRLITQIEYTSPPEARERYDNLRAGADKYACAPKIAEMDSLHRTSLYTALLVERLQRKTARIAEIFAASQQDWNQTFHVMLLQAMGGDRNKNTFASLAEKATAAMVSREKSSPLKVEALLLGAAGFLFDGGRSGNPEDKDDYTQRLEDEARHLLTKYSIVPLKPAVWNLAKLYPANHPVVRLVEIAALLCKKDFMLDGMLGCRTSAEIERLFAAEASEYWRTHYTPSGAESAPSAKTIGRSKARLIGINLAAPLMFAYGRETGAEELCERALDLLATIPAEKNRLLAGWYEGGCTPESGFESQALLQLTGEYCTKKACADCRIGRREIKKAF
jgi:hypothetical protein